MSALQPPAIYLVIDSHGTGHCIYDETFDVLQLGDVTIRRGSYVEPDAAGGWTADLHPVGGPCLGPFAHRSAALRAERAWLETFWLSARSNAPISNPRLWPCTDC